MRPLEIAGERHHSLTAVKKSHYKNGATYWLWKCDCGNERIHSVQMVRKEKIKSCGCQKSANIRKHHWAKGITLPNNQAAINLAFRCHCKNAIHREIENKLSLEEWTEIAKKPCHYCGEFLVRKNRKTKEPIDLNTVDRINNELFYAVSNCVPACLVCQMMKKDMTEKLFIERCSKVLKYRGFEC